MGAVETFSSGRSVFVERRGDGPGLLCIHGLGGGSYFFTALGEALKARAQTVAFDLPGHGFSPRDAEGFSFERCADLVLEIARNTPGGPLTLLGHSLGTIVALKAFARAPELFDGIIAVGGIPAAMAEARARLLERAEFIRARGSMAGLGESILPFLVASETLKSMPGMLGPMQRLIEVNDAVGYADACEALASASAEDVLPKVKIPCGLMAGREDRYAPPEAMWDFARRLPLRPAVITFEQCGHFPFFEKPAEFHAAVRAFLES
jgi:3-oxoadipate enol-lactonase